MEVLSANKINKKFGTFTALENVDLKLQKGEILGLLGPNGAGKTTLIQILLGLLTPDSGEVKIFGLNLAKHRSEILEKVNFSSTYINLPGRLTVKESLNYTTYFYDVPDRKKNLNDIITNFKLEKLLNKQLEDLSSGQLTRVNMAKAFLNNPEILFLDEPTASLDPVTANYVRKFLLSKQNDDNLSVIFTSHNMAEVEEVCDRVVFLNKGKIIADGSPAELARTIEIAHVTLLITAGDPELNSYCQKHKLPISWENNFATIDIAEKQIAKFLQDISKAKIIFDEIRIQNPTLEDYFLQKSKLEKNETS